MSRPYAQPRDSSLRDSSSASLDNQPDRPVTAGGNKLAANRSCSSRNCSRPGGACPGSSSSHRSFAAQPVPTL